MRDRQRKYIIDIKARKDRNNIIYVVHKLLFALHVQHVLARLSKSVGLYGSKRFTGSFPSATVIGLSETVSGHRTIGL